MNWGAIASIFNPVAALPALFAGIYGQNYNAGKRVAAAEKSLAEQRQNELNDQANARSRANATNAIRGQTFGRGQDSFAFGSWGFGSGTTTPGLGRGSLIGE